MMMESSSSRSRLEALYQQVKICRKELKNLRENVFSLRCIHEKEVRIIKSLIEDTAAPVVHKLQSPVDESSEFSMQPIGYIESLFKEKNGIPHQSNVCPLSKSWLKIKKSVFTNPQHSLVGLEQYSHIWIIFIFHKNRRDGQNKSFTKAKIQPPRLNGKTVGLFATRSPHRPNPIGLTLTCLEKIEGETLYLSGVDLLDGTPVIDIKPYIPSYDMPKTLSVKDEVKILPLQNCQNDCDTCEENEPAIHVIESELKGQIKPQLTITNNASEILQANLTPSCCYRDQHPNSVSGELISDSIVSEVSSVSVASWIAQPVISTLQVVFSSRAEIGLNKFHEKGIHGEECGFCLKFLHGPEECKRIIQQLLQNDPRSVYRRKKCCDRLYYFTVDKLHVTTWFDDSENVTEVLRVIPLQQRTGCLNEDYCDQNLLKI